MTLTNQWGLRQKSRTLREALSAYTGGGVREGHPVFAPCISG